jgi:hypothetical protein
MKRFAPALLVLATNLVLVAPAWASDNGEGLLGETDDRDVTFFSLGVVCFFIAVVCLGTYLQTTMEKRKQARKAEAFKQSIGW